MLLFHNICIISQVFLCLILGRCLCCLCRITCSCFCSVCCSWLKHLETVGARGQGDNCVCANTQFCETQFFVFFHPTEWDRGSFTPVESVTHHEAGQSPVQYIWKTRFQSHTTTLALHFWNIHLCKPDVFSIFSYSSSSPGLGCVSLIRIQAMLRCCYSKVEDSTALPPLEQWKIILHALQATATHLPFCQPKTMHFFHSIFL